ncbi:MAG: hemerythrin domain-containing protein [Actinophytocola sp.]|uniref:hemerythrin domain-containing protein n=1 Tax=Actinophytocola sp. TaxID=1872138 RepID=UPI003D6C58A8
MTTTEQQDLIDAIIADHREVESVFAELEVSGDRRSRRELVEHLIAELVRHSVAEEQYLYPAARKALPDGDEIADHELEEHAEAEELMKALDGTDVTDPRFDELRELGKKFQQSKKIAPTRPHPSAPDRPPANKTLGPGVGLIDRMRDALSGRNT